MTMLMLRDHLALVLAAMLLAVGLGVPLGLASYLYPKAGRVILRLVDLIQTTPALALLGVIMVAMGPGKPTVVVGLALYSLLPIVRNTSLGLSQVPAYLKEAGDGMGMTRAYRLRHVEMPLALPMLFTGVRIAAVNAIGTAVFAAFVGGGGLGGVFYTAIRQKDLPLMLKGTAVLMVMALILELALSAAERRLNDRRWRKPAPSWLRWTGGLVCAALCAGLLLFPLLPQSAAGTLVLYDGDYTEVKLMHRIIRLLVEDQTDLNVDIRDQMTQVNNYNALRGPSPSCDLMFTYDGTVLTTFLGQDTSNIPAGESLFDYVNGQVAEDGLRLLGKVGLNNTYAVGVTAQAAQKYGLSTISDLAAAAPDLRFGAEHEFFTQEGSMKFGPFTAAYGLNFRTASAVDVVLKYQALEQGAFDAMIVYTTDGLNKRAGLTILADDKGFFPEYNGAILVREDLFSRHRTDTPELEQVLSQLTGQVSSADMVEMTYAVDVEGRDLETVAHDFLVQRGLLA